MKTSSQLLQQLTQMLDITYISDLRSLNISILSMILDREIIEDYPTAAWEEVFSYIKGTPIKLKDHDEVETFLKYNRKL